MYYHPTTTKSDETTSLLPLPLPKGEYRAPTPTDLRSPCPVINSLANHGYIARSGRNIRASDLRAAMSILGISIPLRQLLTSVTYLEHRDPSPPTRTGGGGGFWAFLRHPFAYVLGTFGVRAKGQVDALGAPCLNLDDLDRHGAIEHDVSMSRRDFAQGDNHTRQADLIAEILASSSSSSSSAHNTNNNDDDDYASRREITVDDWAGLRVRRIEQQRHDNPHLNFGPVQNRLGLAETALIQKVFGDGSRGWAVPVEYVAALFGEERLPVREGWRRRRSWWWPFSSVGIIEMTTQALALGKVVEGIRPKA